MTFLILVIGLLVSVIVYLLRKRSWRLRSLGFICLLFLVLYLVRLWSPWYIMRGAERVQSFSLNSLVFESSLAVKWLDDPIRLLVVPVELLPGPGTQFTQPKQTEVLVADLEARQASWLPAEAVNLNEAQSVFGPAAQIEEHDNVATLAALPGGRGPLAELSFFGFSLSLPGYNLAIPFGDHGWVMGTTYFGQMRLAVREFKSGSVVVELNQTLFNAPFLPNLSVLTRWLPGGRILIFSAQSYGSDRVLALGPFITSQNTKSKNNKPMT